MFPPFLATMMKILLLATYYDPKLRKNYGGDP